MYVIYLNLSTFKLFTVCPVHFRNVTNENLFHKSQYLRLKISNETTKKKNTYNDSSSFKQTTKKTLKERKKPIDQIAKKTK